MGLFCKGWRVVKNGEPTAEEQLLPSVEGRQVLDPSQTAGHGSAQVTRVAQPAHCQAVQVNGLHQVRKERPLEASHTPSIKTVFILFY